MNINYDDYLKQCWELFKEKKDIDVSPEEFENLYELYKGDVIENDQELLNKISEFISEYPIKFLDTPLGQIWGYLKFQDDYITVAEAATLMSCSAQNIKQNIVPKIKTKKSGGTLLLSKKSLNELKLKKKT